MVGRYKEEEEEEEVNMVFQRLETKRNTPPPERCLTHAFTAVNSFFVFPCLFYINEKSLLPVRERLKLKLVPT